MIFVGPDTKEKCPHCGTVVVYATTSNYTVDLERHHDELGDLHGGVSLHWGRCPACSRIVIDIVSWQGQHEFVGAVERVHPVLPMPVPPPVEVPPEIGAEYIEAARLRTISPRASAALARRCLQLALHDHGFRARSLEQEIEKAEQAGKCSTVLAEKLHMVRMVGNYAAHGTPDDSGGFLTVEPGELEALFGALDEFFDVFYVKPARHEAHKEALNRKLVAAGKPPIG